MSKAGSKPLVAASEARLGSGRPPSSITSKNQALQSIRDSMGGTIWACSICGPSKDSKGWWCALGCGRDYNEMVELRMIPVRRLEELLALAEAAL